MKIHIRKCAPIALFVYNRPLHTARTVQALQKNNLAGNSQLNIFSDAPRSEADVAPVENVRKLVKNIRGFKTLEIIERRNNCGLAQSIITGVSHLLENHERVIVLEDDLETVPVFLNFMNEALAYYENEEKVFSISGYNLPAHFWKRSMLKEDVYVNRRCHSWGWASWKRSWEKVDWDVLDYEEFIRNKKALKTFRLGGKDMPGMLKLQMEGRINSWAIRWCYAHFKNSAYCLYPSYSLVRNIGMDGTGIHCLPDENLDDPDFGMTYLSQRPFRFISDIRVDPRIQKKFAEAYSVPKMSLKYVAFALSKVFSIIKRIVGKNL